MEHEEPHEEKNSVALVPSSKRGGQNAWAEPTASMARKAAVLSMAEFFRSLSIDVSQIKQLI
jgi:hypothetical protein